MANMQHRLAALWFADIVGFSQLSHEDESGALEVVQLFQGIARDTVGRYGGHVIKFVGDGALAEFHSTEAAIRSACSLRSAFSEQTKANDLGERDLHIGVHVGEIATTPDGDVYGDGVNATARIMNQAEPGQILASNDVWNQLRQRKEFQFEELGERDLRGAGQHVLHCVHVEDESSSEWDVDEEVFASKLGTLYDELKRRRVFRVATAYAVIAWLVAQVADLTVDALFLQAWITRTVIVLAILGFPIAIAIAWAYDITREGLKRTPPKGTVGQTPEVRFPLLQQIAVGLVVAAVLIGGWIGWDRWGLGPTDISESRVAILPFDVRSTEALEYLGEGMATLIATKIGDVEDYHSVDPHAVLEFVERRGLRDIDSQAGRTVAERLGAGHYVLGSVIQIGEQLHLEASVYDSDKQDPTTQISVQGEADELMGLVDQLVGKILVAELGESDAGLASLAAITTDSLDALKEYLEADREYRAGSFSNAIEGFQRAVEIDSLFALAYYGLATSASWQENYSLWNEAATNALRYSDRLSAPYQTLVQASHALVTGRPVEVRNLVGPYLDRHPNDIDALYLYGESLFHYNDFLGRPLTEARAYFNRALDLDPDNTPLMSHLMDLAALEGDFARLDSLLQRVEPESDVRLKFRPLLVFATGDSTDQAAMISELKAGSTPHLRQVC
jgi:class 3 adenylate cyclase/tetratricopeptide (TPR) repeat protein